MSTMNKQTETFSLQRTEFMPVSVQTAEFCSDDTAAQCAFNDLSTSTSN